VRSGRAGLKGAAARRSHARCALRSLTAFAPCSAYVACDRLAAGALAVVTAGLSFRVISERLDLTEL